MGAAFGPEHADRDPVIRPSQFADFQANAALALAKRSGCRRARSPARIVEHLDVAGVCRRRRGQRPRLRQPHAARATGWPTQVAERRRRPAARRAGPAAAGHPDRLLRAQRGQGDARRAPAHHGRRRRAGPHPGAPRAPRRSGRTTSATGARRSACSSSTCSTSARTPPRRALLEHRPQRVLPGGARASSTATPEFADRARRRVVAAAGRRPRHAAAVAASSSTCPRRYFNTHLRHARRHPDRRRPRRRVDVQRPSSPAICDELEAAGHRDGQRRRAVRLPRRLHRPRGQAGAADHPQERRRLRLRHHRPGHDPLPRPRPARRPDPLRHRRPAGACTCRWSGTTARKAGWLPDDVEVVHVQIGNVLGPDGKILRTRSGAPLRLHGAARRGGRARRAPCSTRRRPELDRGRPRGHRPRRSASAR